MAQDKKSPLYTLYESLKADNYDVPDTYESFERTLTASGKEGTNNRVTLYNSLRENNYDVPDTYESFANTLFVPVERPKEQTPPTTGPKSSGVAESLGDAVKVATAEPVEPMYTPGMKAALADSRRLVERMTPEGRKRQRDIDMSARMAGVETTLPGITKMPEPKVEADDKGASTNTAGGEQAPMLSPEVAGLTFDEDGNAKAKWQLGTGRVTSDILEADAAEYRARESRLALQRQRADMTVGAQLQRALEERKRLDEHMKRRKAEIDARKAGHPASFISDLANNSHSAPGGMVDSYGLADYSMDEQYRQLESASRKNNETIQTLSDKMGGQMDSFWHSLGAKMADGYTLTDGLASMNDAISLMDAKKRLDEINRKRGQGEDLTQEEEAAEAVLKATIINDDAQARYGSEYGAWARAGMMLPGTLDMMKDIMLTPGAGTIAKGIASGVSKGLGRAISKVAGDKVAENIAARFITKATGIMIGAHAVGAMQVNTTGISKTIGEAGLEFAGDVEYDDKGNYIITGQNSAIGAMLAAERNQIREYGSEMFGEFIPGLGGVLLKGIEKIGLKKLSGQIKNIGTKTWYNQYSQLLKRGGFNGLPGEGIEEYEGYLFDALTGHMSDAVTELSDLNTHIDIWLGCATTGAILGGVPMAAGGMHTAQYYRYRHKAKKSDTVASETLGADRWAEIRDRLDYTPNEGLSDALTDIIGTAQDMTAPQKVAVMDYVRNLVKMRGYNIAQIDASEDDGGEPSASESINDSFRNGYTASTPQEMADAQNMYELQRKRAVDMMGEENLTKWVDEADPVQIYGDTATSIWSDEERDVIRDYINAKIVRAGMIQRVNDDIDEKIAQSNAMVDLHTNKATGVIQPAVMGLDDRQVYIVSGNIVTTDTGAVDLNASDDSIVVCDATTGRLEFSYPKAVKSVGEAINPEEEKSQAAETIRQRFAQAAVDKMNGTLAFNSGEVVPINDGNNTVDATIVGPAVDQTSGMPVEGQIVVQYPGGQRAIFTKEQLQAFADAANLERLNGFEQNRTAARAEAKRPKFDQNDEFTILDDNGRPIRGSIVNGLDEDGNIEISTEDRFNGLSVQRISPAELEKRLVDYNGEPIATVDAAPENADNDPKPEETATEPPVSSPGEAAAPVTALSRVPADEHGKPNFEAVDSDTAWDAIVEKTANEKIAQSFADNMVANAEAALKSAEKAKTKTSTDIDEFMEAENERLATIERAKAALDHWKKIAGTTQRRESERRAAEDAEARRLAQERAEEEVRLKAEREEAERREREEAEIKAAAEAADRKRLAQIDKRYKEVYDEVKAYPSAIERLGQQEPETIEEVASLVLSSHKLLWGDKNGGTGMQIRMGVRGETGFGEGERRKLFGMFASAENGGQSIQRLAEDAMQEMCGIYSVPYDNSRARDALIDVLMSAQTRSDITNYIRNQRLDQAMNLMQQEQRWGREEADRWAWEGYGMSYDDYEAMVEIYEAKSSERLENLDEAEYFSNIADETKKQKENESGRKKRSSGENESSDRAGDGPRQAVVAEGEGGGRSGGAEILHGAQPSYANGVIAPVAGEILRSDAGTENADSPGNVAGAASGRRISSGEAATELTAIRIGPTSDSRGGRNLGIGRNGETSVQEKRLTKEEASGIIAEMEEKAIVAPEVELTIENWDAQFGEGGIVSTPIGNVKMGENQFTKLMRQGRNGKLGMIKPTLENPDIIIEDASEAKDADVTERESSYVFVKAFVKPDGSRYYYFTSVTVRKDGHEVVVSNQEKRRSVLTNLLIKGKLVWKHADNVSTASDVADGLYSPQGKMSDPASEGTVAPQTNISENKVSALSLEKQENSEKSSLGERVKAAEAEVDTNPTEGQKEAGNYKKGHVRVGSFDVTIEQPVGSVRRGTDADGKEWETTMQNTYGYIRGTEGVDGDHIDVFLSTDIDGWNGRRVVIVDQYNPDGTFDEHKVMLGFNEKADAINAYLANYEKGWEKGRRLIFSTATLEDFEKWIESSHRKQKPYHEYKIADKAEVDESTPEKEMPKSIGKTTDTGDDHADLRGYTAPSQNFGASADEGSTLSSEKQEDSEKSSDNKGYQTIADREGYSIEFRNSDDGHLYAVRLKKKSKPSELKSAIGDYGVWSSDGRGEILFYSFEAMTKFLEARGENVTNLSDNGKWAKRDKIIDDELLAKTGLRKGQVWKGADGTIVKIGGRGFVKGLNGWDFVTTVTYPDGRKEITLTPATRIAEFFREKGFEQDKSESQLSDVSADKDSALSAEKQEDKDNSSIGDRAVRIEDFGEKIAGARKDALSDIAKSVENVTVQSLIELPLSKAFKRPSLKKLVDSGAISDEDAILAEAVMQSMVYAQKKPVLTRKPRSKREIAAWAQSTYEGIKLLGEVLSGDAERKAAAMAAHKSRLAERLAETNAHIAKMREWNPGRRFDDLENYPDPISIIKRVLEGAGYRPGDKVELPLTRVELTPSADRYDLSSPGKQGAYWFKRYHETLDSAIDTMILAARLAKGDMDVELPQRQYSIRGVGDRHKELTGKYVVQYIGNKNAYDFREEVFATEEKAREYAEKKNGRVVAQERYTNDYDSYAIVVINPLTGNAQQVSEPMGTRAEVTAWLDEHPEEVNAAALDAIYKETGSERSEKPHFYVRMNFSNGKTVYSVVSDDKTNPWQIVKDFRSRKEAEEWLEANKAMLEAERNARKEKERAVVYYDTAKERLGEDYRHGKDATPEMFGDTFGFRGVQFGNWTNDADRQEGLNQAYDALMDMARALGITPRAVSLDGELGLAFGARGSGRASAHYEPTEVVINLTKTRGAGTLAHEWWHAVDNFLSRRAGIPYGYASHLNGVEQMHPEVRDAIEAMMSALSGAEYSKRSALKGDYWGRPTEMMARLFETWMAWRLAKDGGRSPFLASGTNPKAIQMYQTLNYLAYRRQEMVKAEREGRKSEMTQDEFNQKPESLYGYPYPIESEVEQFASKIEAIFTALVKREQESGSLANSPSRRYGKRRGTVSGASLFDWADSEERRLADEAQSEQDKNAEAANSAIDRYCEAFKGYAERTAVIENRLAAAGADSAEAAAMHEQLEYEESAILEERSRLEEELKDYYIQGNSAEDALRISRDMVYRVQGEVTSRLDSGRVLQDILEQDRKPQLSEDPTDVKGKEIKTSGGVIAYDALGHLPDPKEGEFGYVERRFSLTGEFGFTGDERIRDRGDVAYLFRSLENYGVEHVFAVLVKDGKYKVIHLGMGSPTMSAAYMGAIRAGYDAFGADKIYLVHNHPSGNLISSPQDRGLMRTLEQAFDGVEAEGIIMDTTSGRYHIFDSNGRVPDNGDVVMEGKGASIGRNGIADRPREGDSVEAEVVRLDRLEPLEVKDRYESMSTPAMVEQFISSQRLGSKDKVCYMVLTNNLEVVGNFHTGYKSLDADGLAEEMASVATKYGGTRVIVYGNMPLKGVKALGEEVKRLSLNNIALTEVMSVKNGLKRSAYDEGLLRDGGEAYQSEAHEPMMSDSSRADFDEMLERAVAERGIVMPGLNEATVKVVEVPRHDFTGTGKEALMAAETWGKAHITGIHTATDSQGVEFEYSISNDAVEKYVSRSATGKSANIGVHLAALKRLPEIISTSIEAEIHADYKKGEAGKRKADSKINPESLIHRFYGAANIDGTTYRVKTTMREYKDENRTPLAYSYEITQIELLEAPSDGVANNSGEPLAMTSDSSISAAKLLQGVEKSYDSGVKILEASEKNSENNGGSILDGEAEEDVLCRPVTDKATLDRLNSEPTIKVYRAMQMIDGGLRPPMSGKVDGQWRDATEVGVWEEAEEHPEMADENGRFKLDKGNGKSIWAAYNPYIHTSRSPINDQFSSAWSRPELVVVEVEIPESELTSGYRAEKAKDSVGEMEWKSGPVGRALAKIGQPRRVILSRWSRIIRVVPVEEVAEAYAQRLNAHGIEVPFNTVPPALREALAERGVKIGKPEKGNAGKSSMPAFEQWIMEQERLRQGDGYGAYSDAEVSYLNDPVSKVMGKNRFSKKRQAELAARERQRMATRIQELADKLHLDNVEILTDASQLEGKRATAKGFYNKRTGKITIIIPNNVSTIDAEQTLLHEAVAHYGLRQLFGEHFDTFLDNVYQSADESIRRKIAEMAAKNGWDFRTATEEYLAGLAENTNFNEAQNYGGWWSQIKRLFLDMLEKIGFEGFRDKVGVVLTDNELRYILWRSYENLAEPGRYRSIFGEAEDVAMQAELKVGNYAEQDIEAEYAAEPMDEINDHFNTQLRRWADGAMRPEEVVSLGSPRGAMRIFLSDIPILLRQKVLSKSRKKHGLTAAEMKDLPEALAKPIFVFKSTPETISVLTVLKSEKGDNLFVAIELEKDLKMGGRSMVVNDILTIHGREIENVVLPIIENGTLAWTDKEKGLEWLHSAKSKSQAITDQDLEDAAKVVKSFENPTIEDEELFRPGDFTPRDKALARDEYERIVSRGSYQFQEAMQDSMLGLKELYRAILGKGIQIEDVPGFENAYLFENRMSSMNAGEQHEYFQRFMRPLLKEIARIAGANKRKRRELTDYLMAKHGLERNAYMRNEAAANDEETNRDFAGLIGLTGEADWQSAEATAQQWVDDYESMHDTTALWGAINKATKATLETVYLSGLISKETYEKILGMYKYYIPLRGWNETTSEQVYGYLTSKDGPLGGSIMKKAAGRESMADDPIATIGMMADDAIRQSNRNLMKQRFLNFILNHPSDAVSVHDIWLEYDDVADEWRPVFADLEATDTADEVAQKVEAFEQRMEALRAANPDKYKRGREAQHIPYKVVKGNLREHQILIKRNGRTFVATINGNPRAAQALNGLTNPDVDQNGVVGNMLKAGTWVNRQLSAFYTTRNPDFVVSNFFRDMLYANCMTWVKESPRYALRFHKNFGRVNPVVMRRLLGKWESGKLDMNNRLEAMFYQFMKNGGETGYTNVRDIEGHKRAVAAELKKQSSTGRKVWTALGMQLDLLNRSAENCARFAAFVTSREFGRSIDRAIYDAKEVSVNFNKKGSGGKMVNATGQTKLGKAGAYIGGGGRLLYVFWNAGLQGTTNFGRQAKRHPVKFTTGLAAMFALGYVIPMLAQMLGGGDGDDDDKNAYYNLPEYIRRSNICFRAGEQWITIPLPIEYRAIYGMGELAYGVISGNEHYSNTELAYQMAAQVSQIMPLDVLEGGGGISPFIPSAAKPFAEAYIMNKSWTGLPVYKETPFNTNDPEWTKAYASADKHLVAFAKWLNETTGGDDFTKGAIDINPAKIEYLLNGTFGGVISFPSKSLKFAEWMAGSREFEWRNVPIANRLVKSGDERTANRKLNNEYFKYLEEYKETGRRMRKYENADENGIMGYAERINFLENSPEYQRYEIFDIFKADIDAYQDAIGVETDKAEREKLEAEKYGIMRELVNALHDPDDYMKRNQE